MPRVNLLLGEAQTWKSFERGQTGQSTGSQEMFIDASQNISHPMADILNKISEYEVLVG
jgi:hypothetical protein